MLKNVYSDSAYYSIFLRQELQKKDIKKCSRTNGQRTNWFTNKLPQTNCIQVQIANSGAARGADLRF